MAKQRAPRVVMGIPTLKNARRSVQWTDAMAGLAMPLGSSMGRVWVEDETIAAARNAICQEALRIGADYLFFLSDDVLPPSNALLVMLEKMGAQVPVEGGDVATVDMITGVYWTKTTPSTPYLWEQPGLKGAYLNWRAGEFFPIDLAGCDCLLIDCRVLREMPAPWFSTDWVWYDESKPSSIATEDFYFFTKARKYGFRLFADTSIECLHEDRSTGQAYGLTADMPQAGGEPEMGDAELLIADLGAGTESPYFGQNCRIVRFDARPDLIPDVRCDLMHMPENHFDKYDVVHSRHVLEHFGRAEAPVLLTEWTKLLKIGGKLIVRVPNVEDAVLTLYGHKVMCQHCEKPARERVTNPDAQFYARAQIYGGQQYPLDFHKNGWDAERLLNLTRFVPGLGDATVLIEQDGINLKLEATLLRRPKYDSIGAWWEEIEQAQANRRKLPELDYDNPAQELPAQPLEPEKPVRMRRRKAGVAA